MLIAVRSVAEDALIWLRGLQYVLQNFKENRWGHSPDKVNFILLLLRLSARDSDVLVYEKGYYFCDYLKVEILFYSYFYDIRDSNVSVG